MKNLLMRGAAIAALCAGLVGAAQAANLDEAAKLTAEAKTLSNGSTLFMLCRPKPEQVALEHTWAPPPPTKVFDNLYFVGRGSVSAWAITTSDGIILIDSLDNPDEAQENIIGGLKTLGLDPNAIKYDIVTHGHGDHYGGARWLQDHIPGIHVLMSENDYGMAEQAAAGPRAHGVLAPKRDMVVTDGEKLTLGDTTITLYITPGHTPGTVSMIIPVKDHGKPHLLGLFGGSTFPPDHDSIATFKKSLARFRKIMVDDHVSARISNHVLWDNGIAKLKQIHDNPDGPNPYLETPAQMALYGKIQDMCMQATIDQIQD